MMLLIGFFLSFVWGSRGIFKVRKYGKDVLAEIMAIEEHICTIKPNWDLETLESFCQRVFVEIKKQYP